MMLSSPSPAGGPTVRHERMFSQPFNPCQPVTRVCLRWMEQPVIHDAHDHVGCVARISLAHPLPQQNTMASGGHRSNVSRTR